MADADQSNGPTIAVAGVTSLDITLREAPEWMSQEGRDVYTTESLHKLDAPVEMVLGGNGGAAAYVLGKLGASVELYTSIGSDPSGQLVRGWLLDANVQCRYASNAESTMVNITAVDGQGKRLGTLLHSGAELDWTHSALDTRASWLLVLVHSLVGRHELAAIQRMMKEFQSSKGMMVLDTGMGWIVNSVPPDQIHELWSLANIVVGTTDELSHWTGCAEPELMANQVLSAGAEKVIVKMGADGAAFQSNQIPYTHQPAVPIETPDRTIGAGDAFAGAVVASLARGESLAEAAKNGQQVAARVVESGRGVLGWGESKD